MIKKLIIFIIIVAVFVGALIYFEQDRENPYDSKAFFSTLDNIHLLVTDSHQV